MKNLQRFTILFAVVFWAGTFTQAHSQGIPYSLEQLNRRLDSLNALQQEAIRSGGNKENYSAEKSQVQRAITTRTIELKAEIIRRFEESAGGTETAPTTKERINFDFFSERPLLDKLVIITSAIAILAVIFLIFVKIFIAISRRPKKPKIVKVKKQKETKDDISQKTANVLTEIDRYKEKEVQKAEFNQSVIASLKELSKNEVKIEPRKEIKNDTVEIKAEEPPKKMRAVELKNEIVRKFDSGEDTAKIAQDFDISKDQVVLILNLAGRK